MKRSISIFKARFNDKAAARWKRETIPKRVKEQPQRKRKKI